MKRVLTMMVLLALILGGQVISGAQDKNDLLFLETESTDRSMPLDSFLRAAGKLLGEEYLIMPGNYSQSKVTVPMTGMRREELRRYLHRILFNQNLMLTQVAKDKNRTVYSVVGTNTSRRKIAPVFVNDPEYLEDTCIYVSYVYPLFTTRTEMQEASRIASTMLSEVGSTSWLHENQGNKQGSPQTKRSAGIVICDMSSHVKQIVQTLDKILQSTGSTVNLHVQLVDKSDDGRVLLEQNLTLTNNDSSDLYTTIKHTRESITNSILLNLNCTARLQPDDKVYLRLTNKVSVNQIKEGKQVLYADWSQTGSTVLQSQESVEYSIRSNEGQVQYALIITPLFSKE